MRTKFLLVLVVLAGASMASSGIGLFYNADVSVTQANTATTFTDNGSAGLAVTFYARHVLVRSLSSSANTCYLDLKDTVATTSDIALEPGGALSFTFPPTSTSAVDSSGNPIDGWPGIGAICSTGQTATFRVTAMR